MLAILCRWVLGDGEGKGMADEFDFIEMWAEGKIFLGSASPFSGRQHVLSRSSTIFKIAKVRGQHINGARS